MKYFTAELYARGNSTEDAVVQGIESAWERALQRYERRWQKIKPLLPAGVQRFDEARICLHDAEALHLARQDEQFVMVLQPDQLPRDLVILTFSLTGEPVIDTAAAGRARRQS